MSVESRRRSAPRACTAVCLTALFSVSAALAEPALQRAISNGETNSISLTQPAPDNASKPAHMLLDAIVTWLAINFELPANYDHPKIEFATSQQLATLRFGAQGLHAEDQIVAVYLDSRNTIVLPAGWTGRTAAELSVLVHEMVHHLQNTAKKIYNCPAEREKLAFDAQEKWLGMFGTSLEDEFQLDPFTRLVATRCL